MAQDVEISIYFYLKCRRLEKSVAANFNLSNHSTDDLSSMVIGKMKSKNPNPRKKKDSVIVCSGDEPGPACTYIIFMYTTIVYTADIDEILQTF